ncbi:MAG: septum formation inhibitor Maf [Clostridia bacterium]|nr:septum formation inhibitor Maf [Clostridia bacterium]
MKEWILASKSPRRQELLGRLVDDFKVMVDDSPEEQIPGESPARAVMRLAAEKAEHIAKRVTGDALILAADTVVVLDGEILGKPKDEKEAFSMLSRLSGCTHQVYTGISVLDTGSGKSVTEFEVTKVRFRAISREEIRRYIASGEPMDKAGAYGIQELGALFVEGIDGDYFNVVGLPLCHLGRMLEEEFDIRLGGEKYAD